MFFLFVFLSVLQSKDSRTSLEQPESKFLFIYFYLFSYHYPLKHNIEQ